MRRRKPNDTNGFLKGSELAFQRRNKVTFYIVLAMISIFLFIASMAIMHDGPSFCNQRLASFTKDTEMLDLKHCWQSPSSFWTNVITIAGPDVTALDLGSNQLTDAQVTTLLDFGKLTRCHTLFLSDNLLTKVPNTIRFMPSLTRLSLKVNAITEIDPLRDFPATLEHLILTENQIGKIHSSVCHMQKLRKFMLAGNKLDRMQFMTLFGSGKTNASPCKMEGLELVRFTRNRVERPLLHGDANSLMATIGLNMPKLAWISFAGNPIVAVENTQNTLPDILSEIDCTPPHGTVLGSGTSGVVTKCAWKNRGMVAVKTFRAISSDGSREDELRALERLGAIPLKYAHAVLRPVGRIGGNAVVFPLLNGTTIAHAPNIQTITVDRYDEVSCPLLDDNLVFTILNTTAVALCGLHKVSLAHGDIYAHNIFLDRTTKQVWLTDFGASFDYSQFFVFEDLKERNAPSGNVFERVEIRAWCVLVNDLFRWKKRGGAQTVPDSILDICGENSTIHTFEEIVQILQRRQK